MKIEVPQALKQLAQDTAFPVYITGGFVRNAICSLSDTDIDICGPVAAQALGLPKDYRIETVNFRLGTSIIKHNKDKYEYTPFRVEQYKSGGDHSPASVSFTTDMRQDVLRRDFCCNSLYYDIKNDELIDLCGGVEDCKNKLLRAADPEFIFSSDGLRLMRLVRIAAETGFKIEAKTALAAEKSAHLLKDISPERIRVELDRILTADLKYGVENAHYRGLKLLQKLGLLKYVLPPLAQAEGVPQNPEFHKYDVLEHSFQTARFAHPSIRLAALLHDVAKPYCLSAFGKMHGHEKSGCVMVKELMGQNGLRYSKAEIDEVSRLVLNHMYDLNGNTSESKMKMFIIKNNDIIEKLVLLNNADRLGSGIRVPYEHNRLTQIKEKMIAQNTPFSIGDLKIDGAKLLELGVNGKRIGEALQDMLNICVLEPRLNNEEWLISHAGKFI